MRVKVNIVSNISDEEATINTVRITKEIEEAKALLENSKYIIAGTKDGSTYNIEVPKIYYVESIDNKTIVYTKSDSFLVKQKLYELEEILDSDRFLRCSKSMILNARKIKNVKSDLNARIIATLLNDEVVIISRSYTKDLKKILGI